jgi:amino acid permease
MLIISIILVVIGIIMCVIYSIMENKVYGSGSFWLCGIGITLILVFVIFTITYSIVPYVSVPKNINEYSAQKEYLEHKADTQVDNYELAGIVAKKLEYNSWLINAKYSLNHHGIMSTYRAYEKEILALEPIQ